MVKVDPGGASPVDDAELSIKTEFATVTERAPVRAYLLIKNKTSQPFQIATLRVYSPQFLSVSLDEKLGRVGAKESLRSAVTTEETVAPYDTRLIPLKIEVRTPQSGEWLLVASVTLARGQGPLRREGVAIVDQEVTVGVPGVSDVLKILDLPSILIIPGALVLATWSLLLGGAGAALPKWLEWKSSSFWIVAITISILVFGMLYRLNVGPDFLVAFGIAQVAWLWIGCVGGAAIAFLAYRAVLELRRRMREPLTTDRPIDVLKKLQRANLPFYLPCHGEDPQRIYELAFSAPDGMTWVVPRMLLRQLVRTKQADDQLRRITSANGRAGDGLAPLVEALEEALRQKWVSLAWEAGRATRPQLWATSDLGQVHPNDSPVAQP